MPSLRTTTLLSLPLLFNPTLTLSAPQPLSTLTTLTPRQAPAPYGSFTLLAFHVTPTISQAAINFVNGTIQLLTPPTTYCPTTPGNNCASFPNDRSVLTLAPHPPSDPNPDARDEATLLAETPGGQRLYIDGATGQFRYTAPHQSGLPAGAVGDGFVFEEGVDGQADTLGVSVGALSETVACDESGTGAGPWVVYAKPAGEEGGCDVFQIKLGPWTEGPPAFGYVGSS